MPRTPDFLFSTFIISFISQPYLFIRNSITPASISPARVPMGRPASGVRPMVVSTHFPFFTAAMEEPLPRWQVMIFSSSMGLPSMAAARWETKRWEVPWKP